MINAKDLRLLERGRHLGVDGTRAVLVPSERLLDDDADEPVASDVAEPRLAQAGSNVAEQLRRGGQVEDPAAGSAARAIELVEHIGQLRVCGWVVVAPTDVPDRRHEIGPLVAAVLARGPQQPFRELAVCHWRTADADEAEFPGQPVICTQPFDRGQQLAFGEVAGRTEYHQYTSRGAAFRFDVHLVTSRRGVHLHFLPRASPARFTRPTQGSRFVITWA